MKTTSSTPDLPSYLLPFSIQQANTHLSSGLKLQSVVRDFWALHSVVTSNITLRG